MCGDHLQTPPNSHAAMQCEALIKRGIELEDAGRLEEACKLYSRVLAEDPRCVFLKGLRSTQHPHSMHAF